MMESLRDEEYALDNSAVFVLKSNFIKYQLKRGIVLLFFDCWA